MIRKETSPGYNAKFSDTPSGSGLMIEWEPADGSPGWELVVDKDDLLYKYVTKYDGETPVEYTLFIYDPILDSLEFKRYKADKTDPFRDLKYTRYGVSPRALPKGPFLNPGPPLDEFGPPDIYIHRWDHPVKETGSIFDAVRRALRYQVWKKWIKDRTIDASGGGGGGGTDPWGYGGGWGHGLGTGSPAGSGWGGGGSASSGGWGSGVGSGGPSDWGRPDLGGGFGGGGGPASGGGGPASGGGGPPGGSGGPERTGGPQDDNDKRGDSSDEQGVGERQGGRGSNGKSGGGKPSPKKSVPKNDPDLVAGFAFDDGGPAWVGGSGGAEGYNPNLLTDMRLGRGSRRAAGSAGSGPRFSDLFGGYRGGGAYDDVPDRNWVANIRGAFVDYAGVPLLTPGYGGDDGGGGNFGRSIGDGRRVGAGEGSYGSAGVAKNGERLLPNLRRPGFDVGETAGDPDRLDKFDHRGMAAPAAFAGVHNYVHAARAAAPISGGAAPIAGAFFQSKA